MRYVNCINASCILFCFISTKSKKRLYKYRQKSRMMIRDGQAPDDGIKN